LALEAGLKNKAAPAHARPEAASRRSTPDPIVNLEEVFRSGNRRVRSVAILGKRLDHRGLGDTGFFAKRDNFRSAEFVSVYVRSPSITGPIADVQLTSVFDPKPT
jgi:hypothetical protein